MPLTERQIAILQRLPSTSLTWEYKGLCTSALITQAIRSEPDALGSHSYPLAPLPLLTPNFCGHHHLAASLPPTDRYTITSQKTEGSICYSTLHPQIIRPD